MKNFRKHLLIGMTALSLGAGAITVHAADPAPSGANSADMHGKSEAQMKERMEKRQKALHDSLKLSAQQEAAWNKFVEKMKPGPREGRPDSAKTENMTAPERMDAMLARMKQAEARMTERAAAVKEFYAVLTPDQQKTFNEHFAKMHGHHRGPQPR
jgi:Spy/CpxP family protein refolding chaperone